MAAYSKNILPDSGAYYNLYNASITGASIAFEPGGYAELSLSKELLPVLTSKMLVVIHPSVFSSPYTNDAVQVELSIITAAGEKLDFLISASETSSGVYNTEIDLPAGDYTSFTYKISSSVQATVYNWELCSEQAEELTAVIEGVEQSLPKLLYDYNTYAYSVGQRELTVGLISCYLLSATDLQGHFTLSFFATERCNVHVRIKDNEVTELYSPQVFTVEKGYSSISIPHSYLHKLATDHAFSVTVQCTNGQLSIPVRGMLYTIDGGYLATRMLDAGVDIEDISIKQLTTDVSPSEIWAAGFEGDRLILKKRVYNQLQRVNWEAIRDFGECLKAVIEFPGAWTLRGKTSKFTLETAEVPYVFIVDLNRSLKVYTGASFENVFELDTNVTALAACQGFNMKDTTEHDQGMIVAYIKAGNAYVRQYIRSTSGTYAWQSAQTIYEGGNASFVSIHRLPDYRIGLCITYTSGTKWFITERLYVGQGIKPEIANSIHDGLTVATVYDASSAPAGNLQAASQNTFTDDKTHHNGFVMTFSGPLIFLKNRTIDNLKASLKVYINGTVQSASAIKEVMVDNNVVTVLFTNDVKGSSTVKIAFNNPYLFMLAYNGCYAAIKQEYSWTLPIPTTRSSSTEKVKANIQANANVVVSPIITSTRGVSEACTSNISTTLNATVRPTVPSTRGVSEQCEAAITSSVSISVSQAGTVPI